MFSYYREWAKCRIRNGWAQKLQFLSPFYFSRFYEYFFSVPPLRRYLSENGIDSDQCGQTAETACKTLTPVLDQIHTLESFVSPDILDQVKDVWRDVFDQF